MVLGAEAPLILSDETQSSDFCKVRIDENILAIRAESGGNPAVDSSVRQDQNAPEAEIGCAGGDLQISMDCKLNEVDAIHSIGGDIDRRPTDLGSDSELVPSHEEIRNIKRRRMQ